MQPYTIEKQGLPVIIDPTTNEPVALIYFSHTRERIIYLLSKATEEDIIQLLSPTPILLKTQPENSEIMPKMHNLDFPLTNSKK